MRRYILLSYFSYRFINPAFLVLSFMLENDIQIIIMAGGVGCRFWPMSTPDYPKQSIDVMGVGRWKRHANTTKCFALPIVRWTLSWMVCQSVCSFASEDTKETGMGC